MMKKSRAFTLVEMLVVVAILSLLIGIVLPVVGQSKAAARQSVCMSNLAQLGHAADQRAVDHLNRYFEYREVVTSAMNPTTGTRWWFGFEPTNGQQTQRPLVHEEGVLGSYLSGIGERLQCDAFAYNSPNHVAKFTQPAASYGYNWKLSGMRKLGSITEIPDETIRPQTKGRYRNRLSEVFIFADSVFFEPHANSQAFFEGYYIAWQANTTSLGGYAHFRHFEKANVAYLDGHVEPAALMSGFHKIVDGAKAGNLTSDTSDNAIYGD